VLNIMVDVIQSLSASDGSTLPDSEEANSFSLLRKKMGYFYSKYSEILLEIKQLINELYLVSHNSVIISLQPLFQKYFFQFFHHRQQVQASALMQEDRR